MLRSRIALAVAVSLVAVCGAVSGQTPPDEPRSPVVAEIDGRPVTVADYTEYLLRTEGTRRLDGFIRRLLLEREARRLGVALTYEEVDRQVARRVAELRAIYGREENGLEGALGDRFGTWDDYERWLRDKLLWETVLDRCILATRVITPFRVRDEFERRHGPDGRQRRFRHILVASGGDGEPASSRARELRVRVEDGHDLSDLARLFSDDAETAEDGGALTQGEAARFGEDFVAALARLSDEAPLDVVRSREGWHVVEFVGVVETSFDDVRGEIGRDLHEAPPSAFERRAYLERLRESADIERYPLVLPGDR